MDIFQLKEIADRLLSDADLYSLIQWFMSILIMTTIMYFYLNRQVWVLLAFAKRRYRQGETGLRYYKMEGQVMPDNTGGLHYNLYFNGTAADLRYCKVFGQFKNGNNNVLLKVKHGVVKSVVFESEEYLRSLFDLYSGYFKMTSILSTGVYLIWIIL